MGIVVFGVIFDFDVFDFVVVFGVGIFEMDGFIVYGMV